MLQIWILPHWVQIIQTRLSDTRQYLKKGNVYIGTSGWHYRHWIGPFYPEDTRSEEQLDLYIRYFKTVEVNNSFYKLPSVETFEKWRKAVPGDFLFSVKASRFITHLKKLKVDKASVHEFLSRAEKLKHHLGPVLFQLPPNWKLNTDVLEAFLKKLPEHYRYTFEFRNATWYTTEVYQLLEDANCAFCIYELDGHMSPMEVTADFVYIRLHGPGAKYQGSYSTAVLKQWRIRIAKWRDAGKDVYVYFDNDEAGYAAHNALKLAGLLDN